MNTLSPFFSLLLSFHRFGVIIPIVIIKSIPFSFFLSLLTVLKHPFRNNYRDLKIEVVLVRTADLDDLTIICLLSRRFIGTSSIFFQQEKFNSCFTALIDSIASAIYDCFTQSFFFFSENGLKRLNLKHKLAHLFYLNFWFVNIGHHFSNTLFYDYFKFGYSYLISPRDDI